MTTNKQKSEKRAAAKGSIAGTGYDKYVTCPYRNPQLREIWSEAFNEARARRVSDDEQILRGDPSYENPFILVGAVGVIIVIAWAIWQAVTR